MRALLNSRLTASCFLDWGSARPTFASALTGHPNGSAPDADAGKRYLGTLEENRGCKTSKDENGRYVPLPDVAHIRALGLLT
jgi:hypothetical protein